MPGDLFHMLAMRFVFIDCDEKDIIALYKGYCATFFRDNVPLIEAPIEFFPGGAGIQGSVALYAQAAATVVKQWTNGAPDPRAINAISPDLEIRIGGENALRVELNGPTFTSTAAIFLRCYLDGVWEKAAQG
jgi:hypothetical protein